MIELDSSIPYKKVEERRTPLLVILSTCDLTMVFSRVLKLSAFILAITQVHSAPCSLHLPIFFFLSREDHR